MGFCLSSIHMEQNFWVNSERGMRRRFCCSPGLGPMSRALRPWGWSGCLPTQQAYTEQASQGCGSTSLLWLHTFFIFFPPLQQLPADESVDACLCLGNHQSKEQNSIQIGRKCCFKSWKQAVFCFYKKLAIKIAQKLYHSGQSVCWGFFKCKW